MLTSVQNAIGQPSDSPLGLRIAWGGAGSWQWTGRLWLDQGQLHDPHSIVSSADAPGSIFLDGKAVRIVQPRPRPFDEFDVFAVGAPETATLFIELQRSDLPTPFQQQVPLKDLLTGYREIVLDDKNNRLLLQRTPGDQLVIQFDRKHLVFTPGESLNLSVTPNLPALREDATFRLSATLYDQEGSQVAKPLNQEFRADLRGQFAGLKPIQFPLPDAEGVYDLDIQLSEPRRRRLTRQKSLTLARRKMQLVVIDPRQTLRPGALTPREVVRIEPTEPRWKTFLSQRFGSLPGLENNLPTGNRPSRIWQLGNEAFVQLEPTGWHAYPVSISQPGVPHIIEVTYPADVEQTFTISVVEGENANRNSALPHHSGVHVGKSNVGEANQLRRYRMFCWPNTEDIQIVLTNQHPELPASFGTIHVEEWTSGLPIPTPDKMAGNSRQILTYLEKPWFTKSFSATSVASNIPPNQLNDWRTFYEGGTRLAEYLKHTGYSGVLLSVYGGGSTLYPSLLLDPNHQYDTGTFQLMGQDPVRKDILEMLLRIFDREGLTLVPTLRFDATLPRLERMAHRKKGVRLIGPDGSPWTSSAPQDERNGAAPHYNPLHPQVQAVMLKAVQEVVNRYAHHPSFGGLALDVTPQGYAALPGPYWGLDDHTVSRFAMDTRITLPGEGALRHRTRAQHLQQNPVVRDQWLYWRSGQLAALHHRVQSITSSQKETAKLFLLSSEIFNSQSIRQTLTPTLPPQGDMHFSQALLGLGLDPRAYQRDDQVVLVQPRHVFPGDLPGNHRNELRLDQLPYADIYFGGSSLTADLLFHTPVPLNSHDWMSELRGAKTADERMVLSLPEMSNRHRLATTLARNDSQVVIDGGTMLPLSQDASSQEFANVFRQLPIAPFTDVSLEVTTEPAIIRTWQDGKRTCIYMVNESAWPVQLQMELEAARNIPVPRPIGVDNPSAMVRQGNRASWNVTLEPYGLIATWLDVPQVDFVSIERTVSEQFRTQLEQRIQLLKDRLEQLEREPKIDLLANPSFEHNPIDVDSVRGWETLQGSKQVVNWQSDEANVGRYCLKLTGQGTGRTVSVRSDPFQPPSTGRFQAELYLRAPNARRQPRISLALEVIIDDQPITYRTSVVGAETDRPLAEQWEKHLLQADDLPLNGLGDMRLRMDVFGEGDVLIDHIQTSILAPFSINERRGLLAIIGLASRHLNKGDYGKCQQVLDGYWIRFLEENVELPATRLAAQPQIVPLPDLQSSPEDETSDDSWFDNVNQRLRRWLRF
ncbi:MAG: family 10 glycosylhydrolase [Pirellulaceae bacterium]|nr:family 10 glycosylhydrolase [Pirellulaceae bacterium]